MSTDLKIKVNVIENGKSSYALVRGIARQGSKMPGAMDLGEINVKLYGMKGSFVRLGWDAMYKYAVSVNNDLTFK